MATEFYKGIPPNVIGKLDLYHKLYGRGCIRLEDVSFFPFFWDKTPEGYDFWLRHQENNTFPKWSDQLNRFIDPPQVNTIPEPIRSKIEKYCKLYPNVSENKHPLNGFVWDKTPEGDDFWNKHYNNSTYPIWSFTLNHFIDGPPINTITVNADEYQAMREFTISKLKALYDNFNYRAKPFIQEACKSFGIDINEITN